MQRLIMKFGGTSVGNAERIREVAMLLKERKAPETVVVTSAMSGVTDKLVRMARSVVDGVTEEEIKDFASRLREKHLRTAKECVSAGDFPEVSEEIERLIQEMEKVLIGVSYVGELTPRSLDFIQSFGERLSAPIVSGALRAEAIPSISYTGFEAGVITDSNFGKAKPLMELTERKVAEVIAPRIRDSVPVVTGFVAGDESGRITTLSRGGSDYTAAILGAVLGVDEIWIWTDVDGILSTNPEIAPEAMIIEEISFVEAMELAYFGAKVIHPMTIEPAMEKEIPVRVKNTFNPDSPGTVIVKEQEKSKEIVKAVTIMNNVVLLTISGVGMIGVPGVAARVFTSLAEKKVNILMISQGSSEANISLIIDGNDLDRAVQGLKREFLGANIVRDVQYNEDVAVIAVVGAGMRGTRGIASRIFSSVASAGANILMIAQGSSEVNISFVVSMDEAPDAVRSLHGEFIH